jgi:acetyltransferase-like isoleucine patch superfamily enzyme
VYRKSAADWLVDIVGSRASQASDSRRYARLQREGIVTVGRGAYGIPKVLTFEGSPARLQIGNYVSITSGATFILGGNHPTSWTSLYPFRARWGLANAYADGMPTTKGDIVVGHDAWIGHDAVVMSGVSIGIGAIVAAGAVVTKSTEDYSIVGGNPGRFIRYRFDEGTRRRLAQSRWWDLPEARLRALVPLLSSSQTEAFLAIVDPS